MPREPIGAKSNILADIGRKFIRSGLNYEDMLKKLIGEAQAYALSPKGTEENILQLLKDCKVELTNDERLTIQALIQTTKDPMGSIPVLDILAAIGLQI